MSTIGLDNKGRMLVREANNHRGTPYEWGGNGPDNFDCSGFVKYVYKHAIGYDLPRTAFEQQKVGKLINGETVMAGDLVFFQNVEGRDTGNTPNITHVGMFLGEGLAFIHAGSSGVSVGNADSNYWKPYYHSTKRILDDNDTYAGNFTALAGYASGNGIDAVTGLSGGLPLSKIDDHAKELLDALDKLNSSKTSRCSLIDLTYGGEFIFYMPESFTESIPISWDTNGNIMGRSVPAVGYTSSGPRSIPIEFTMVAGVGEYEFEHGTDPDIAMEKMYNDLNFLRSLEYPDYSSVIVSPPSVVLLSLSANTKLKGVVSNLNVTYQKPTDHKGRSMVITVSFTVSQVSDEPPSRLDILNNTIRSY